jgi:hypothetical protein
MPGVKAIFLQGLAQDAGRDFQSQEANDASIDFSQS